MNNTLALRRIAQDVAGSWGAMPRSQALRWYGLILWRLPAILRERKLYAADLLMPGEVRFALFGQQFRFDLAAINATPGNGYAFLRELFVRNIYFRAFERPRFDVCLDLGCNVAIVSAVLRQLAGPEGRVVAVDAIDYTANRHRADAQRKGDIEFDLSLIVGDVLRRDEARLARLCEEHGFDPKTAATVGEIMARHGLDHVDMVKIDLEGAEFHIFAEPCPWLQKVDNVTMEVHPHIGNPRIVVDRLRENGFAVDWCDPYGFACAPEEAGYVYASRVGALRRPR